MPVVEEREEARVEVLPPIRRRYTDDDKAEALAQLDANGGRIAYTARQLGIPLTTLYWWEQGRGVDPAVVQLRSVKREELGEELRQVARIGARLALEKAEDAEFRDLMVGVGIAVQRSAELLGENVAIIEHRPAKVSVLEALETLYKAAQERDPAITLEVVKERLIERRPELAKLLNE